MDTPRIHTFSTKKKAAQQLASSLGEECEAYSDAKRPLLLLFSGGSALSLIDHLPTFLDASFLTLSVVDERDDPSLRTSNFQELKRTPWFRKMIGCGASSLDPLAATHLPTGEKAIAFERALRQWKEEHEDGSIIALLGMGADGHTAGIFPTGDAAAFASRFQGRSWVIGYAVPEAPSCSARITTTLAFLQQEAARVYVFICGREKSAAWEHLLARDTLISALPILGIYEMRQVALYTDLPAAPASQG
jgi:6-phosphogluconolactonase/glucosamine-6-phosphate isomerase/deaminase